MKINLKKYGIIAFAGLLLVITSSAIPIVDTIIEKAIEVAGNSALLGMITASILMPLILVSRHYFTFANVDEFSSVWNPAVTGPSADPAIVSIVKSFITLLQPFYVVAIIITGFYLILATGSPAGRAKAKSLFWKLMFSMVLVTLSMQLFQIILNISAVLTMAVASIGNVDSFTIMEIIMPFTMFLVVLAAASIALGGFPVVTFLIIAILFNFLIPFIVNLRYIIVIILAILFPFTIFLHFLDFSLTRAFGARLVRLTFIWVFLPVVIMLAVVGSKIVIDSYSSECGTLFTYMMYIPAVNVLISVFAALFGNTYCFMIIVMSLIGTVLIVAAPLMMSGVMTWIGAGLAMYGMANFNKPWATGLTTFGGILAGMGPGALMMGGTQAMFAQMAGERPSQRPPQQPQQPQRPP